MNGDENENREYIRSDLACETGGKNNKSGYKLWNEEKCDGFTVSRLRIATTEQSTLFGKPIGRYVTVSSGRIWLMDDRDFGRLARLIAREIRGMCREMTGRRIDRDFGVLIAGLGNSEITADAVGPECVRRLSVTRHLRNYDSTLFGTLGRCEISAVFPGVLGQTGIETVEMVRGAVENAKPDVVIVVDALAARSLDRLAATVQLSDSGIEPGSGIGNDRKAICRETVGVPVLALGVPTVVNSSVLVYDALEKAGIREVDDDLRAVLENGRSFFVSPKENDVITRSVACLLSEAIDRAFTVGE